MSGCSEPRTQKRKGRCSKTWNEPPRMSRGPGWVASTWTLRLAPAASVVTTSAAVGSCERGRRGSMWRCAGRVGPSHRQARSSTSGGRAPETSNPTNQKYGSRKTLWQAMGGAAGAAGAAREVLRVLWRKAWCRTHGYRRLVYATL